MNRPYVPQDVLDAAHARASARSARQWEDADRLRAEMEAAGWRVVDAGTNFRLEPIEPPDLTDGDFIRYGRSTSVPSRMADPRTARATLVVVASDAPGVADRTIASLLAQRDGRDQIVVIIDGPEVSLGASVDDKGSDVEVIRTATTLGAGAAINIGIRCALGSIMVLVDAGLEVQGDIVSSLAAALEDPGVAVVSARGRRTADLRTNEDVPADGDATSIARGILAFRHADAVALGPVDEAFVTCDHLDTWWSLTLRARSEATGDAQPRRARVIAGLLVTWPDGRDALPSDPKAARLAKRNFYRLLNEFRDRPELLDAGTAE